MGKRKRPKIKLPGNRKDRPVQEITLSDSGCQLTKAEREEKHSIFTETGTTEEERRDNMIAFTLRPAKIRRKKS